MSSARPIAPGLAAAAGVVTGVAGLATSYLTASLLNVRQSPVVAIADFIIGLPIDAAGSAPQVFGSASKPLLVGGVLLFALGFFALIGRLAARDWGRAVIGYGVLAALATAAIMFGNSPGAPPLLPVLVGLITWLAVHPFLLARLAADASASEGESAGQGRRTFLIAAGAVTAVSALGGFAGRFASAGRRRVEASRDMLRLVKVTPPEVPAGAPIGVSGVASWMTRAEDFYLIDTAIVKPVIAPEEWELRIHGLVENELRITYAELLDREFIEGWVTLNCVSNQVGGDLVGNAWWSGVRIADLLAEAGPLPEADAVLQTSVDGWNCGTPIGPMTDDRNAMLAVAMNGEPLTLEHGFPVRAIVPGLYGYVSATKWVVDWEVTRFADFDAYWTQRGWGEMGPVKMASRIDVPRNGDRVPAGETVIAGSAWLQHTGIANVEVSVDGGPWFPTETGDQVTIDSWRQWRTTADLAPGPHQLRVRASSEDGEVQTGALADVLPDGATGWHTILVEAG